MLIEQLSQYIYNKDPIKTFWNELNSGTNSQLAVSSSARPFLVAARFNYLPQCTLVIVSSNEIAKNFAKDLMDFLSPDNVLYFPTKSHVTGSNIYFENGQFYFKELADPVKVEFAQRNACLNALVKKQKKIIVASASNLLDKLPNPETQHYKPITLKANTELKDFKNLDEFINSLITFGYKNSSSENRPGTFSQKGGILNVFPAHLPYIVNLDFFGEHLEEIRKVIPSTGQMIENLDKVEIYPVRECGIYKKNLLIAKKMIKTQAQNNRFLNYILEVVNKDTSCEIADVLFPFVHKKPASLLDYVSKKTLYVQNEPKAISDSLARTTENNKLKTTLPLDSSQYYFNNIKQKNEFQQGNYYSIMLANQESDNNTLPVKRVNASTDSEKIYSLLHDYTKINFITVYSVCDFRDRENTKLAIKKHNLKVHECDKKKCLIHEKVNLTETPIEMGMVFPKLALALISENDQYGYRRFRKNNSGIKNLKYNTYLNPNIDVTKVSFPYKPGDYVVHAFHGIGKLVEICTKEVNGINRDYLHLEYAHGDNLYTPIEQMDRITKYVGPEGKEPKITRLGTADWYKAMQRAKNSSKKLAFDLVDIYARRSQSKGFSYKTHNNEIKKMENDFPFQETPDQLKAIEDVKADMAASVPMDRLICGDVGFGKTEVAIRAAFIAAQNNRQTILLCPTTILAQQHYSSFKKRYENHAVSVEVLSRFVSKNKSNKILKDFSSGKLDILIGTHRVLSRDVNPKNLGLIIVDEEQRFGVGHKEMLKNLRENIDVLTLSATPIPRTMQMAVSGVANTSLILTPPEQRQPVEVKISEYNPDLIHDAINFEIARKGQIYYVSNRVKDINKVAENIQAIAGNARIAVAHGQMDKRQLEPIIKEFSTGKIDILISTTIIESGIDNPHTNTLIIEDSHKLGLAQIYQLKGRVGRSNVKAYAYFLFPENNVLTEDAKARLEALNEHQDLGSGMQIALRDLEIRGAGTILGAEQHGNISAVGFDLFSNLLAQEIANSKSENDHETTIKNKKSISKDDLPPAMSDIIINLPVPCYIPEDFIEDTAIRVTYYRRFACASSKKQVEEIQHDLQKISNEFPEELENMIAKCYLRILAFETGIDLISVSGNRLYLEPIPQPNFTKLQKYKQMGALYKTKSHNLNIALNKINAEQHLLTGILKFMTEI